MQVSPISNLQISVVTNNKQNMRKYHQAALAIIAAISLISVLFYRHEYNKLRYVLEVFNYFGKPNQKVFDSNCTNVPAIFTKFNMLLEEPYASWQRIDDDLYVYSAYNIKRNEVHVIGFASPTEITDLQCAVFSQEDSKPVLGTVKSLLIENTTVTIRQRESEYSAYKFICTHTISEVPTGIILLLSSSGDTNDAPVIAIKSQAQSLDNSNTAICVTPLSERQLNPLDMISFINFHDLIGMNNFIVYDNGIATKLHSELREVSMMQNPYWKFTYSVLPWNFPFYGIDHSILTNIIQTDCFYRTYNKAMYVAVLSWNEYIVLRYHHSIIDLLADFSKSRMKADCYEFSTLNFCTEQPDDTRHTNSSLTIFRKTSFNPSITEDHPISICLPHNVLSKSSRYTHHIGNNLGVLNVYRHCYKKSSLKDSMFDSSILRFLEDMENSSIFKRFIAKSTNFLGQE